jgi:hypothetical protein
MRLGFRGFTTTKRARDANETSDQARSDKPEERGVFVDLRLGVSNRLRAGLRSIGPTSPMARCGGRSDCKSCLASTSSCRWCTYTDSTGAAAATCLFEDTANMCEDLRNVCPVVAMADSGGAPIENVAGAAIGVAVGSCGLMFLILYIVVRTSPGNTHTAACVLALS